MIQAMSGLMSITGFEANGPTRVGFAGADVMSGATAAFGVASALYQRTHTGKGQLVDVAMIDAVMGYLAQQFTEHLMTGRVHEQAAEPLGHAQADRQPVQDQGRLDGAGGHDRAAVPAPDEGARPRRRAGRSALRRLADAHRQQQGAARDHRGGDEAARPRPTWVERFAKNDIPAGRVLSIPETAQLDLFQHRTVLQTVETEHGPIKVVGSGFRLEHGGGSVERPPAKLGQHTDEVLGEAGYSAAEIAGMREGKVV